jgi:hypothetical protein
MVIGDGDGLKALLTAGLYKSAPISYALILSDGIRSSPTKIAGRVHLKVATVEMRSPIQF